MKILVTGSKGMVGTSLVNNLKNIKDGKNTTRPNIIIDEIFEYSHDSSEEELIKYCRDADVVFHLAGVNRPDNEDKFKKENLDFTVHLIHLLEKSQKKPVFMFASSIQATLNGNYIKSKYGLSKKMAEDKVIDYGIRTGSKIALYRFPNIMGHSKPNYNSAISTFCWAIANDKEYKISDRTTELEVLYIDDLVEGMFDLLENKEKHCEYIQGQLIEKKNSYFCYIPRTYKVLLGEIVDLLELFRKQSQDLMIPKMPKDSFAKKLFSLYLTYLPKERVRYPLHMNVDNRGNFTELFHIQDYGQISINISKPGIIKGQHWHNSKWEIFMVVSGHGLIQERNINTGETIEFEVFGEKIEAIYMIPGWTHNIINLSQTNDLVTVMMCNEIFDKVRPDTFSEEV